MQYLDARFFNSCARTPARPKLACGRRPEPAPCIAITRTLERQPRCDLNLTGTGTLGRLHVRDGAERGCVERRVRRRIVHVIEEVRGLGANLKLYGFLDTHRLDERHGDGLGTRPHKVAYGSC